MSMNVPILNQMTVIRTLCVPTLKVPTCVVVSKDSLETASVVQVLLSIQIHTVVGKIQRYLRILFEKKWKIQYELLMSLLEMFVVISCFFPHFSLPCSKKNCSVIFLVARTKFARILLVFLSVFAKTDTLGRITAQVPCFFQVMFQNSPVYLVVPNRKRPYLSDSNGTRASILVSKSPIDWAFSWQLCVFHFFFQILMNAQTNLKITVIRTHYVPILRDLTFVAVKEDLKEMAKNV